jgi:hypothetical protein
MVAAQELIHEPGGPTVCIQQLPGPGNFEPVMLGEWMKVDATTGRFVACAPDDPDRVGMRVVEFGGKPSRGTPPDKRLGKNKGRKGGKR